MVELLKREETEEDTYKAISFSILVSGQTVGGCSVMVDEDYAYCERIDIYDEYQRKGYGTAALYELSSRYAGIVVAPDNPDAQRLYERIGSVWDGDSAAYIDQGYGVYRI